MIGNMEAKCARKTLIIKFTFIIIIVIDIIIIIVIMIIITILLRNPLFYFIIRLVVNRHNLPMCTGNCFTSVAKLAGFQSNVEVLNIRLMGNFSI